VSAKVLGSQAEIEGARNELRQMGASFLSSPIARLLRRLGVKRSIDVGDYRKSWDVLMTARLIQERLPKEAPVLDIGAYGSEILCVLARLGYTNLTGVDLNPLIRSMPNFGAIQYVVADFMQSPFPDASFAAITATSVIEHGFHGDRLLKEISRLLRPGGYFVASFDYWPEKIDTNGIRIFDMAWTIFSREEVLSFVKEAGTRKLQAVGTLDLEATNKVVDWEGKSYTFAWLAIQKSAL
jgi:SAM-dependent methyltransferase